MIDVFLRWYPTTHLRVALAQAVKVRLEMFTDIKVEVVHESTCGKPYHIWSKKYAETSAQSEIYCVMDDDQLPIGDDFFELGAQALQNPEYGMVAGMPLEYLIAGQPYAGTAGKNAVIEAHSIGCPYFVRKGTLKTFPDSPIQMYDGDLSKVVTDQGLKTGLVRGCLYNHLGYGFSQVGAL
jgi:hypothetical protein